MKWYDEIYKRVSQNLQNDMTKRKLNITEKLITISNFHSEIIRGPLQHIAVAYKVNYSACISDHIKYKTLFD